MSHSVYWLAHHGIKGQKWGIRRFQNEDGSLTEAGRKRYGSADLETRKDYLMRLRDTAGSIDDQRMYRKFHDEDMERLPKDKPFFEKSLNEAQKAGRSPDSDDELAEYTASKRMAEVHKQRLGDDFARVEKKVHEYHSTVENPEKLIQNLSKKDQESWHAAKDRAAKYDNEAREIEQQIENETRKKFKLKDGQNIRDNQRAHDYYFKKIRSSEYRNKMDLYRMMERSAGLIEDKAEGKYNMTFSYDLITSVPEILQSDVWRMIYYKELV